VSIAAPILDDEIETAPRLLAGVNPHRALDLEEHIARYGRPAPGRELVAELEASGLTGRGGAGFPVASKVRAVTARRGRPVVVVNGVEGEPLSAKDKLLLRRLPHLVLDGAVALAAAAGSRDVYVAHSAGATQERDALEIALAERAAGHVHDRISIRVVAVPDGFVSGQETALVQFLNGGPALPTFTPPRPFEAGVANRPTLIQNAETVAHVAQVARKGAAWFRETGTPAGPGTALFTVSGAVSRPGVREAPLGTPLRALVGAAGGLVRPPRAVLIGGYAGIWIDARDAAALTLDEESMRAHSGSLGVGAVSLLPEGACGLCETARIARYLADESAGQCGPCVHGLDAIADRLERPARSGNRAVLERWTAHVAGRGACRHPDGAARLVASAVRVFRRELETHDARRCSSSRTMLLSVPGSR
jgi:NADH:ubiquinone oxidoreductase subunit F (NADH-binding)